VYFSFDIGVLMSSWVFDSVCLRLASHLLGEFRFELLAGRIELGASNIEVVLGVLNWLEWNSILLVLRLKLLRLRLVVSLTIGEVRWVLRSLGKVWNMRGWVTWHLRVCVVVSIWFLEGKNSWVHLLELS